MSPNLNVASNNFYHKCINTCDILLTIFDFKCQSYVFICIHNYCIGFTISLKNGKHPSAIHNNVKDTDVIMFAYIRCYPSWLPWCGPSTLCHRKQDPEDSEEEGHGPRSSRGSVPPHQEGCQHQKTHGEEQEGGHSGHAITMWCTIMSDHLTIAPLYQMGLP